MSDELRSEDELKASTVSPGDTEEVHPVETPEEEPQEARGAPGSRDEGLPPEETGPANRPK